MQWEKREGGYCGRGEQIERGWAQEREREGDCGEGGQREGALWAGHRGCTWERREDGQWWLERERESRVRFNEITPFQSKQQILNVEFESTQAQLIQNLDTQQNWVENDACI